MKPQLLLPLLLLSLQTIAQTNDFAPVGARWYYDGYYIAPPRIFPYILESVAKETVQGKVCSKLVASPKGEVPRLDSIYVYTQNDTVYFYSFLSNQFEMLYDFTAEAGDSWIIGGLEAPVSTVTSDTIYVDSVTQTIINGTLRKVWHIRNTPIMDWGDRIYENIGNDFLLLPKHGLFDLYVGDLRCYESADDTLHLVSYPCDTFGTWVSTREPGRYQRLTLQPNPATEWISLALPAGQNLAHWQLFSASGQQLALPPARETTGALEWNIAALPRGYYFIRLQDESGARYVGSFVKME